MYISTQSFHRYCCFPFTVIVAIDLPLLLLHFTVVVAFLSVLLLCFRRCCSFRFTIIVAFVSIFLLTFRYFSFRLLLLLSFVIVAFLKKIHYERHDRCSLEGSQWWRVNWQAQASL
jgi:hypothetical protein